MAQQLLDDNGFTGVPDDNGLTYIVDDNGNWLGDPGGGNQQVLLGQACMSILPFLVLFW